MPQKPQDRAKDKRRLTRRLAKWRAKRDQQGGAPETASATSGKKPAASTAST